MSKKKKKKQKIVYVDDNSTIADMSCLTGKTQPKQQSTFKEKMSTYFHAVKMMILPMLCTLAALMLVYMLLYLAAKK